MMLLCAVGIVFSTAGYAQTVKIGVLAFRPKAETLKQWLPLGAALKRAMPQHDFVVEAYSYPELDRTVSDKRVDFVLTNPGHYVLLARRLGVSAPLATLIIEEHGVPLSAFGGVIIARAERADLQQLADLKDMRIVVTATESLGGYQMQAYELALAGLKLPYDAQLLSVGMPHDNVVKTVLDGKADAGFVRTGVLEAMAREGKSDISQLKVLNQQRAAKFPLLLSTRLYPEWPFAALPHADENISRRVAAALFTLEENSVATRAMGIHGFTTPSDYTPVEELLRELRLPPFDSAPTFNLHDVWSKYRLESIAVLLAALLILLLSTGLLLTNRRLDSKRRRLESETRLRHELFNALGEGVYGVDHQGLCIFVNPAALTMLGYTEAELIGQNQHALFHHHYADGTLYPEQKCPIHQTVEDGQGRGSEEWFWRKDGSGFSVFITVAPTVLADRSQGAVVVFRDITEHKLNEERMRHLAQHDTLTELPNRALLTDRLHQALASAKREKQHVALMFIDLDRFKPINDTQGHVVGDWLLKQVANRMLQCIRDSDTVARVGGDEFVVLLRAVEGEEDAVMVAEKIRIALNQPFDLAQQRLSISCSIGLAIYPEHAQDEREMMNYADIAMYQAKQHGRDKVQVFHSGAN